ncbi:hypothetical protein E1263_20515 [Kribbella antibiotica]|uniref:GerMN domain-containing protein n=1 Tax=Kribbella antibiotica TaxID=190195 RepID=A0A4R4ZI49_9ACTN|nr:Gmad2 immunoglobulin-like domain-containing protein [Kribbella antibiotica]TDD58125.1 hypothetical protein E1263_20515 [Kribbella antibiotica]
MNNDDPFDELMRRSLADEANRVEPTDALPEILNRAHAVRRPVVRRPWVVTAGLAAVGTAAAVGAFTVFNGNLNTANEGDAVAGAPGTTASASGAPDTPRSEPTKAPTQPPTNAKPSTTAVPKTGLREPSADAKTVPVYWLGDAIAGKDAAKASTKPTLSARSTIRLYRTWSKISGRPAFEAVRIMTTQQPNDYDYRSFWKGAQVSSVTQNDGIVTVDFKEFPQTKADEVTAALSAQQLIYTVQGALGAGNHPVQVTYRGRSGVPLFGQIDTSGPLNRAQAADVQALVSIESPTEGMLVTSPITVQGLATAFETTVNYRATNLKSRQVVASTVNTDEGQKSSGFSFPLDLKPGLWQIEAYLVSAEDGSISDLDSKTVEVVR